MLKLGLAAALAACGATAVPPGGTPGPRCAQLFRPPAAAGEPRFLAEPLLSAADVRADFDSWLAQMAALHPDLAGRVDLREFERHRAEIAAAITRPMTRREAWLLFARLNPVLRDGHHGIQIPDRPALAQAHLDTGGRLFPWTVHLDTDGILRVREAAAGAARGDRILAINGRSAAEVVAAMMAVTEGDTPAFRREHLARRFPIHYWLMFGDTLDYAVTLDVGAACPRQAVVPGAAALPTANRAEVPADAQFSYAILDGGIGYLRAGSFSGEYADALAAFARDAFTAFQAQRIRALIIDVRDNGGGDDPLWQRSLMEYVTDKPYLHVGRFTVRVTAQNADPGDVIGDIQHGEPKRKITPSPANPLRFTGPVYLLAGPFSFSSTIQFLVAAQDFGIARIAGRETGGLSCQTGRVTPISMPRTGLRAFAPIMSFRRPSGHGCDRGVVPDVEIDDDGLDPMRAPALLAARIRAAP